MTFKTHLAAVSVAAVALAGATASFAQAPAAPRPAAPAGTAVRHGAAIPGMCVLSVEAALGGSTVGKYANTRLQQLAQQVNAELTQEQTAIQTEDKNLGAQRGTLDQNTFDQRAAALQVRVNALQRKAQLRERELQATQQKVRARLGQELEPLARQAYEAKGCSVLLDGNGVIDSNPAMDITPQVVTALNGKITQFAFERERLDTAAPTTAAAPAPARK